MKKIVLSVGLLLAACPTFAQRIGQQLGRGVVAVNGSKGVLVSWRKLQQDPDSATYNVYLKSGGSYSKLNAEPLHVTNYSSTLSAIPYGSELAVTVVDKEGKESEKSTSFKLKDNGMKNCFVNIDFETQVLDPNKYFAKYVWPADLNGDGEMNEYIVDRLCNTDTDNPVDGNTTSGSRHKLQAYDADGKCLWTISLGPNVDIDAGQNDMVTVWDINCDGKAEVLIKSSDGTQFWDAASGTFGKYAKGSAIADTDGDGIVDYSDASNTKRNPPFYISVVDGMTGKEIDCAELNYAEVTDGKDQYSRDNRAYYMDNKGYYEMGGHFVIAYTDGVHPSLMMECLDRTKADQKHHNYVFAFGYNWQNGKPTNFSHTYTWSRNDKTPWPAEFHGLRGGDVDGDGIDELIEGGYAVNPTKGMVMSAGIGHGDRFRVSDIDPERPGMEVFAIQQSSLCGMYLYDAATGEHIKEWYMPSVCDVGRAECMDVDPEHKGYEIYSTLANMYDCKGNVIKEYGAMEGPYPYESIWWDGDLGREVIASNGGSGWNCNMLVSEYNDVKSYNRYAEFSKDSGWKVHGTSGARPAYVGDCVGDWREEVFLLKQGEGDAPESTGFVGYTTEHASDYAITCLQQDPHYALDCTARGYYQSPNTDYYLGYDMPAPPIHPVIVADARWKSGNTLGNGTQLASYDLSSTVSMQAGKSLLFDISGDNKQVINLNGEVKPSAVYLMNPKGHDYQLAGTGSFAGDMNLYKSMQGSVEIAANLNHTGKNVISEGTLAVEGTIMGMVELQARGTLAGNPIIKGELQFEGALNYEGCRLSPGTEKNPYGQITVAHDLTINQAIYVEENIKSEGEKQQDRFVVLGNLKITSPITFTIVPAETKLAIGSYELAECTGTLEVDVKQVSVRGLSGVAYEVAKEGNKLMLHVDKMRDAANGVRWTGEESTAWDFKTKNFILDGNKTTFVNEDGVVFGDEAKNRNVVLNDKIELGSLTFDFNEGVYKLSGTGGVSGSTDLMKKGNGELQINLQNSDFTGKTLVTGGTLTVSNLSIAKSAGDLGATTADKENLQITDATLKMAAKNSTTDREMLIHGTVTFDVSDAGGSLSLKGLVYGEDATLVKTGPGQLNFTYPAECPVANFVLREGKVSQGNYKSDMCKADGKVTFQGGEFRQIENKTFNTMPIYTHPTQVEGTGNKITGSYRSQIKGSMSGDGEMTIVSGGVRCDVMTDFSAFTGKLIASGTQWRMVDVSDMKQATLYIAEKSQVGHYVSGSGTSKEDVETYIGKLEADAATADLSKGYYNVGYNNEDALFAGKITAKKFRKYGKGTQTLTSTSNKTDIWVEEGTLYSKNAKTTGILTVDSKAVFTGFMTCKSVTLNDAILRPKVEEGTTLNVGDEVQMFKTTGVAGISGTYTIDGNGYEWDDSELLTEGKLKVKAISTGIEQITVDSLVDVYTLDGVLFKHQVKYGELKKQLAPGLYIVNGKKVVF